MTLGIRTKVVILFGCLLVMSLANFLILKHAEADASRQLDWVDRTHQVLIRSEQLLGYLRDAETGQRGFLLTNQPAYLTPYASGVSDTYTVLDLLRKLTDDNPGQQQALQRIDSLIDQKFTELAATIELAESGDIDAALRIVREDIGRNLMQQIRAELADFQRHEAQLLNQRKAAYAASHYYLELLFAVEAIVLITLIVLISIYVQKKLVLPITALAAEAEKRNGQPTRFTKAYSGDDEIGALARSLADMHRMLIDRTEKLQQVSMKLAQQRDKAVVTATQDALTGLYNRRKFEQIFKKELRRAQRQQTPLSLALLDVDFFKKVNDTYGHAEGDNVLKKIALRIEKMARRPSDFTFRIGGEEFVFLTTAVPTDKAFALVDQLRADIEAMRLPNHESSISPFVTVSAGIITLIPGSSDTQDSLLKQVDKQLYRAKSEGRNRVCCVDAELTF